MWYLIGMFGVPILFMLLFVVLPVWWSEYRR